MVVEKNLNEWLKENRKDIYLDSTMYGNEQSENEDLLCDYYSDGYCSEEHEESNEDYYYESTKDTNQYECELLFDKIKNMVEEEKMNLKIPRVDDHGEIIESVDVEIFNDEMKKTFYEFIKNNSC